MKLIITFATALVLSTAVVSCTSDETPDTTQNDQVEEEKDTAFVKTLTIKSEDSLDMTVDQYHINKDKPVIILCHQAGWSRGEYKEIAVTLNGLDFNCIALDQRSGNAVNGVTNQTAANAQKAGTGQTFLDAEQDIRAAIAKFSSEYKQNIILWGSSYSSSLALKIAVENVKVDRVLSFSPGEYLTGVNMANTVKNLDKPSFLTSSKSEANQTKAVFQIKSSS